MSFLQFNADLSKIFKSVKAVDIYASKRSRFTFSENENGIMLWRTVSEILKVWSRPILLNYSWVSIFFDILIANNSWTLAQTPINHIILKKSVMRTFRCIYTSCFNRLRFFAENRTKLQKMNFFGQFRTTPLLGNMEVRQMASFFHLLFSALTVCNTMFCIWK